MFDFQGAFERERQRMIESHQRVFQIKKTAFEDALANARQVLAELKAQGMMDERPSPVADWMEQFYEHGCVWLDEEMQKITKHWMGSNSRIAPRGGS